MKLALIQPFKVPTDLRTDGDMLGLVSIATYLKEYMGFYSTFLIDSSFVNPIKELKKIRPDIVGISSMAITQNRAVEITNKIKEEFDIPRSNTKYVYSV